MAIQLPVQLTVRFSALARAAALACAAVLGAPAIADHHGGQGAHADHEAAQAAPSTSSASSTSSGPVLYESGVHYEELLVPVPTSDPSKVEVIEMFSYLCIHCFNFDAAVHEWSTRQGSDVSFSRVPAIFNKSWAMFAQAFYTAEALGVSDKTHDALFEAVHTFKQDLRTPDAIAALFKRVAGVEKDAFMKTFNSFSVRSKVQQADSRARQVRLQSVPTLIVNGKYKTNSSKAGTNVGMLQVVDFLVKKEQAAAAKAAANETAPSLKAVTEAAGE